ncbi:MAG: hypothetical protein RR558_09695 [Coprobacillus sp.]
MFGDNEYKVYDCPSEDIIRENFDVFFLDVMLDGKESFDFGEQLSLRNPKIILVYISSMDDFVYDSIYQTSFFFVRKSNIDKDLIKKVLSIYNYVRLLEKDGYSLELLDGTISSTYYTPMY